MKKCFVTYETRFSGRLDSTVGLALLIASIGKHMPGIPLYVFHTEPCDHLKKFARKYGKDTFFKHVPESFFSLWYGKSRVIIEMLNNGFDRVCWIDSDMIALRDCVSLLLPEKKNIFVVASDKHPVNIDRYKKIFKDWPHFIPKRSINSCIISATIEHMDIIQEYDYLLNCYSNKKNEDKALFLGDQEYLEVAMMKKVNLNIKIHVLRNYIDIFPNARDSGIKGSLIALFINQYSLIHALNYKPWWPLNRPLYYASRTYFDCSPYTLEARKWKEALREIDRVIFLEWLVPATARAKICLRLPPKTKTAPLLWFFLIEKFFPERVEVPRNELEFARAIER